LITNGHTLPDKAAQVFTATKPKLAIYSHLILGRGVRDRFILLDQSSIKITESTTAGGSAPFRKSSKPR